MPSKGEYSALEVKHLLRMAEKQGHSLEKGSSLESMTIDELDKLVHKTSGVRGYDFEHFEGKPKTAQPEQGDVEAAREWWLIRFDDVDVQPEVFNNETAARARFAQC